MCYAVCAADTVVLPLIELSLVEDEVARLGRLPGALVRQRVEHVVLIKVLQFEAKEVLEIPDGRLDR